MAVRPDGTLWATGYNAYGELGDGTTTDRHSFVQVVSEGVKAVAAGWYYTMMLKQDGSLWAAGWNSYGQLGDGTTTDRNIFVEVVPSGQCSTMV